jgi:hypothetical protein
MSYVELQNIDVPLELQPVGKSDVGESIMSQALLPAFEWNCTRLEDHLKHAQYHGGETLIIASFMQHCARLGQDYIQLGQDYLNNRPSKK